MKLTKTVRFANNNLTLQYKPKKLIALVLGIGAVFLISKPAFSQAATTAMTDLGASVTSIKAFSDAAIPVAVSVAIVSIGLMIFKRVGMS